MKRCKNFFELPGSPEFARRMASVPLENRSHTVLLSGAEGSGKTAWAKALAAAWLCSEPTEKGACGRCESCSYLAAGTHPDYTELVPEKAGARIPIDELRSKVHAEVSMAPQIGSKSVWFIAGDALSEGAQNALLKVLEEPPAHAYFVLTVSETARLLPTLLSRAVILAVPPLGSEELDALLQKEGVTDPLRRRLAVTFARGLPGLALEIAGNERFPSLRREFLDWLKTFPEHTAAETLTADFQFFESIRSDLRVMMMFWQSFVRDISLIVRGADEKYLMHRDLQKELEGLAASYPLSAGNAEAVIRILNETEQRLLANGNFEMQICRMLLLTREEFLYARNSRHQVSR